jgi:amidohydrolase
MRPNLPALLTASLLAAPAFAQSSDAPTDIATAAQAVQKDVVSWRRDIHQHPELGNNEVRTAKLVADQLRKLGLQVRTGIAHTGVVAVLKGGEPGPRIALRADMDALPVTEQTGLPFASKVKTTYRGQDVGVMHACGHDAHVAILLGVATALAARKATLPGEVMFIFQPSEEGPPNPGETFGARLMLDEGVFRDFRPDAVFGLHVWAGLPVGQVGVRSGPMLAAADE